MDRTLIIFVSLIVLVSSCCSSTLPAFDAADQPPAPDYTNEAHWSALPFREDAADVVPHGENWISDSAKPVDVFYVYPTIYRNGETWNADVADEKLNKKIDKLPVRLQASVFNKTGRVYAPRYRQSDVDAFYSEHREEGAKALEFAYQDVKAAFEYFLEHYNNDRPIVLASHSQGTWHLRKLVQDYFDGTELQNRLVCAYIVGYAIYPEWYKEINLCGTPDATNCYVTWSSFEAGYEYPKADEDILVGDTLVNPISWTTDTEPATADAAVLLNPAKKKTWQTTAWIDGDQLAVDTRLLFMRRRNNLHLVDYNLFWYSIRANAETRVNAYLKR